MVDPTDILAFWLDEIGPEGWYTSDSALDARIRDRFAKAWDQACDGNFSLWLTYPSGALAYIILTDQFSRNMFRDSGKAFASDPLSLAVAKSSIRQGYDLKIDAPARQFFYLPLMHSENLSDQDRCVRLMVERMPDAQSNLLHAQAHREVIRQFGRFPHRNDALGRESTSAEESYLSDGGYGKTVRDVQASQAA